MIMPKYNILFDSIIDWNILNDKEITERIGNDKTNFDSENTTSSYLTSETDTNTISDRRFSELPQNQISEIQNGNYMTQYNLDKNTSKDFSNSSGDTNSNLKNEENKDYTETISKTMSPSEKYTIYNEIQKNLENIYEMLFSELNDLFYSIIN